MNVIPVDDAEIDESVNPPADPCPLLTDEIDETASDENSAVELPELKDTANDVALLEADDAANANLFPLESKKMMISPPLIDVPISGLNVIEVVDEVSVDSWILLAWKAEKFSKFGSSWKSEPSLSDVECCKKASCAEVPNRSKAPSSKKASANRSDVVPRVRPEAAGMK